jgi:hypothetical protein
MFDWLKGTGGDDVGEPFTLADEHRHRVADGKAKVELFRQAADESPFLSRAERQARHAELDGFQARADRGEWLW